MEKSDAIKSLNPGIEFMMLNDKIVKWKSDQPQPTEDEIDAEIIKLQAEYDANQYQRDRQYPSIGAQLDMQFHDQLDGTTTWKDAVAKVKSDNPKEAE